MSEKDKNFKYSDIIVVPFRSRSENNNQGLFCVW